MLKVQFIENDYILVWNLLFGASINEEIHHLKQKLWMTYKKQYNRLENENRVMLDDIKNFIPDDDTLYNEVMQSKIFSVIRKETEKHRLYLMQIWDEYKKDALKHLRDIVRLDFPDTYQILVVNPKLDTVYYDLSHEEKNIVWGRKTDKSSPMATVISILYAIVRYRIGHRFMMNKEIVQAVLELAIQNELYTRMLNHSNYLVGDSSLSFLKKQIYPFWLMYLGCEREDFPTYMMRDKIVFDIDKYPVEANLKKLDLIGFIDFCVRNQKHLIRVPALEII